MIDFTPVTLGDVDDAWDVSDEGIYHSVNVSTIHISPQNL